MTSRYASSAPTRDDQHPRTQDRPTHCEIPGCVSLYVGTTASGEAIRKRGKADVFVKDHGGTLRGICQGCYLRGLVAAGQAPNQDLLDADGRFDPAKVRRNWDAIEHAQLELADTAKRTRRSES